MGKYTDIDIDIDREINRDIDTVIDTQGCRYKYKQGFKYRYRYSYRQSYSYRYRYRYREGDTNMDIDRVTCSYRYGYRYRDRYRNRYRYRYRHRCKYRHMATSSWHERWVACLTRGKVLNNCQTLCRWLAQLPPGFVWISFLGKGSIKCEPNLQSKLCSNRDLKIKFAMHLAMDACI